MRVLLVAGGDRYCPVYGASSSQREREVWDQLGPHFTLRTKQRLLSFLVSHQRLANARCSQSRFTREILSIPHQDVLLMK